MCTVWAWAWPRAVWSLCVQWQVSLFPAFTRNDQEGEHSNNRKYIHTYMYIHICSDCTLRESFKLAAWGRYCCICGFILLFWNDGIDSHICWAKLTKLCCHFELMSPLTSRIDNIKDKVIPTRTNTIRYASRYNDTIYFDLYWLLSNCKWTDRLKSLFTSVSFFLIR